MNFKQLYDYIPINEQEVADKKAMLDFIENNDDCLNRTNLMAHFTSSALIVNKKMDKILFVYHNIYDSWSWVGGHNDGDADFLRVAIKEAREETGLKDVEALNGEIMMIDSLPVKRHIRRGKFISNHLHLNLTYLLIASEDDDIAAKLDENSQVRWFKIDEVLNYVSEKEMIEVYKKGFNYINKVKSLK